MKIVALIQMCPLLFETKTIIPSFADCVKFIGWKVDYCEWWWKGETFTVEIRIRKEWSREKVLKWSQKNWRR